MLNTKQPARDAGSRHLAIKAVVHGLVDYGFQAAELGAYII